VHTRPHTRELRNTAFPQQQRFRERALVLRYTYIAYLVDNCNMFISTVTLQQASKSEYAGFTRASVAVKLLQNIKLLVESRQIIRY
jgi:hypothetical protein